MMPCPECLGPTEVRDSRFSTEVRTGIRNIEINNIRRRRRCLLCGITFTTREVYDDLSGKESIDGHQD